MSQYPGAQPPGGPYYAPRRPADPYAPPPPPADPYFGAPPPGDPYAQQAQYQAWQAQQPPGYPPGYPPRLPAAGYAAAAGVRAAGVRAAASAPAGAIARQVQWQWCRDRRPLPGRARCLVPLPGPDLVRPWAGLAAHRRGAWHPHGHRSLHPTPTGLTTRRLRPRSAVRGGRPDHSPEGHLDRAAAVMSEPASGHRSPTRAPRPRRAGPAPA